MFANQLVTYGGTGGIRRGLIWQNGEKREKDYITGHLVDVAGRFLGNYPYGEVLWWKRKENEADQWTLYRPDSISGKHPYVQNGLLYMANWERFNECSFSLSGVPDSYKNMVKTAGFNPIYPQWGGYNPESTPYLNLWSLQPQERTNLRYLPSVNKILERMTFLENYNGFSWGRARPSKPYEQLEEPWVYNLDTFYHGRFSEVTGGFIQSTKFSNQVYIVRNGLTYDSGAMGFCEFRIAKEVDVYIRTLDYYYWFHLLDMPIPTVLIALDE